MTPADRATDASRDVPVELPDEGTRDEFDSMGHVAVPADRYWGAQTQRSLEHFSIGDDPMPTEVHRAYGVVKAACARVNERAGRLPTPVADAIVRASHEVAGGDLDDHFPLSVWQSGSGTQTNMNVNEVIANRAIRLLGGELGTQEPVGPNDHVNMSQSTNDSFPTVMHLATVQLLDTRVLPELDRLAASIEEASARWMDVVKVGRTHLQDAVPLTVGQEWSGWAAQLRAAEREIEHARDGLYELALGGTAVGTGLNAPAGFSADVADELAELTGTPWVTAPNKFAAQASLDAMVRASASLRGLAVALTKIANDVRWLASGPRCGLGELRLPANEPGSSIMPGKVNPTQCEAIAMIAARVLGADQTVAVAGSQGSFELNTMRPVVIAEVLHSGRLLADGMQRFREYSIDGIELDRTVIDGHVERSLMLVTALAPTIGYQAAAHIAEDAAERNLTLREAAIASGSITADDVDRLIVPAAMTGQGLAGA